MLAKPATIALAAVRDLRAPALAAETQPAMQEMKKTAKMTCGKLDKAGQGIQGPQGEAGRNKG